MEIKETKWKLKQINWEELKKLNSSEKMTRIDEYKTEKDNLIQEYIKIQDVVDEYNEYINQICCEIEQINIIIKEMESFR